MSVKKKIPLIVGENWSKKPKSSSVVKAKGKKATLKKKALKKKATKKKATKKIPGKFFHRNPKKKATKAKSAITLRFDSIKNPGVIDTLKPPKPPKGSK